jgi:HSP20 family protein
VLSGSLAGPRSAWRLPLADPLQPGQLGVQLPRFLLELQDAADPGHIEAMDAYRQGDTFYVHFDLPGVRAGSIDLTVEQNVLTVRAERFTEQPDDAEMLVAERPAGTFTRQVFLGDTLDAENIGADYRAGVLTLTIPVHEAAKPRSIQVTTHDDRKQVTAS